MSALGHRPGCVLISFEGAENWKLGLERRKYWWGQESKPQKHV